MEKKLPERLAAHARQAQERGRRPRLIFQDEGRFGRIVEPRRCWAPPRVRPTVGRQVVRESTYVFAALSPGDGCLDSLILPACDTWAMSLFLAEVSARHADEELLMVLDGAGWHLSRDLAIPENVTLERLPPYSPELNPVEHLWDELREKWFGNVVFESLEAVEERLVESLRALENSPGRVRSLGGFNWIQEAMISSNMIAS